MKIESLTGYRSGTTTFTSKMPELLVFPLTKQTLDDKKVKNKLLTICTNMDRECFEGEEGKMGATLFMKESLYDSSLGHLLFLLVEGNKLLCSALMAYSSQITFRWTPPALRKQGYATMMLKEIEALWACTEARPLWVSSYDYMEKSNTKAGWVKFPFPNEDGTQDWYPPQYLERYSIHWHRIQETQKTRSLTWKETFFNSIATKAEQEAFGSDFIKLLALGMCGKEMKTIQDLYERVKKLKF